MLDFQALAQSCSTLALIGLALAGCSERSPGLATADAAPDIIDTAGAVHYALGMRPDLVIGNDSNGSLLQVLGALKLADGNIVIANGHDRQLLVVDTTGRVMRRLGRRGDGPGEFELLGRPLRAADGQFVILDLRLRRLTWLADTGFIRTALLDPPTAVPQPSAVGLLDDGSVLVTSGAFRLSASGQPRIDRDTVPVVRFQPDGHLSNRLGVFPGTEFEARVNSAHPDGALARSPREFGVASGLAVAKNRLVVADNGAGTVALYDSAGHRWRAFRLPLASPAVTAADVKALRQQRLVSISDAGDRERIENDLAEHAHPRTQAPAFDPRLLVDAEDNVWIGSYLMPADTSERWWQVSLAGHLLGVVEVPVEFMPTDVNRHSMVGIWLDEDGVQTVREYELSVQ